MSLFYSKKCYNVYLILEFVKKRLNLNLNEFLRQRIRLIHLDVFLNKVVLDIDDLIPDLSNSFMILLMTLGA